MCCRAEKLLAEYAEAKLALMNRVATSTTGDRQSSDDDDNDLDSATHHSSVLAGSHGHNSRNSSTVNSKAGQKSHTVCRNSSRHREVPASSHHSVRGNSASQENRGSKPAAKRSENSRDGRSPLRTITQQDSLYITGQRALPPLPSEHFLRAGFYHGH